LRSQQGSWLSTESWMASIYSRGQVDGAWTNAS
jgi:hypothetical protein